MDIKTISNDDFQQLIELTIEMYAEMSIEINAFQAVNTLMHDINNTVGYSAIGLYEGNVLMGFVTGHEKGENTFYFSGIHLVNRQSEWTKKLIEYCFKMVEDRGYKFWEVDATNENISSIMEKYGAEPKYTRYRKEIAKGDSNG